MARLHSELVLGVTNHASGPSRVIARDLENLRQQHLRNQQAFVDHRNIMIGTGLAAYAMARSLAAPVQASIEFSTQLEDIRQKADLTNEAIAKIGRTARDVGLDTAQGATNIAGAVDSLVASGAVTPEQAQQVATPLGKASTAYRADPTEMANLTSSIMDNMNVPVDEIERIYEILAKSGNEGKFELKDMAAEFPALTAAAAALGIEGQKGVADLGAALQIAIKGAGSGSEAATNMANFMQKILAPDALKKFSAQGIDMVEEMNRAIEAGHSPIEHSLGILNELTEGGRQDLLGQYFADSEVQKFIRPMLENFALYTSIRDRAMDSAGLLERDFLNRMETPEAKIDRFMASVENLNIAIGNSLVPALTEFAESVTPMIDGVASFVDANGELVAAVVEITAALIGLRLLAAAGGMAGAVFGMGGKRSPGGGIPGIGGKPGSGLNTSTRTGPNLGGWGILGFNALGIGSDVAAFGDAVREDGGKAWIAERDARDAAMNDFLLNLDVGGFKPFGAMQAAQDLFHKGQGGIGGGYSGPNTGQIEAMKAEIAKLDAEIAEWPEEGMEERRARLAETLANMEAELAASGTTVTSQFGAMMEQLRVMAAQGVSIPITMGGPNLGAMSPPVGPRIGAQAPVSNTTTVGNVSVVVQNPTNANPQQIGRVVGQQVADRVNAAHSNGGMG